MFLSLFFVFLIGAIGGYITGIQAYGRRVLHPWAFGLLLAFSGALSWLWYMTAPRPFSVTTVVVPAVVAFLAGWLLLYKATARKPTDGQEQSHRRLVKKWTNSDGDVRWHADVWRTDTIHIAELTSLRVGNRSISVSTFHSGSGRTAEDACRNLEAAVRHWVDYYA